MYVQICFCFILYGVEHIYLTWMGYVQGWPSSCGTKDGVRIPEHVTVDHDKQLIYVKPDQPTNKAMEILHEYNRVSRTTLAVEVIFISQYL